MADAETANALRAVAIGVVLIATFVFFFVYPGHDPEPNHLPVGYVIEGGDANTASLRLDRLGSGVEFRRFGDPGAARAAVLDREIYGALVLGSEPRVLIARAASFQAAAVIENIGARLLGTPLRIEDLRTLDPDDPRGTTLNLTLLPLSIVSILGAMLLVQLAPSIDGLARLRFVALLAVVGGAVAVFIANVALGALPGSFLGLTLVAALMILAIASVAAGIITVVGPPGIMLSFLIFLMLGNPASGAVSAPELLPDPWRVIGEFMPNGAGAAALRNVAYFDGAALAQPLAVMVMFAAIGAILLIVAARRRTST